MKILKFVLLWVVVTITMVITWSVGSLIGNAITGTIPPTLKDPSSAGAYFLGVCIANAFSLSLFFWSVRKYSGPVKLLVAVVYIFILQFLLTQMETLFFSEAIHISVTQIISILIAGFLMSSVTVTIGFLITNKMTKDQINFRMPDIDYMRLIVPAAVLMIIIYPALYLLFGYFVAWQDESLRIFYSQSAELRPFSEQTSEAFVNGIYFFQVFRSFIWIGITIPIVLMMRHNRTLQYLLIALLSASPAVQLFIPNPYMPSAIAMAHFVETSASNFIWGLVIVLVLNRYLKIIPTTQLMVNH